MGGGEASSHLGGSFEAGCPSGRVLLLPSSLLAMYGCPFSFNSLHVEGEAPLLLSVQVSRCPWTSFNSLGVGGGR